MNERLLHTPEGVRDIYNAECEKKMLLEHRLHHRLHLYGFQDIQTPAFEFFDIFNEERGTVSAKEMYRFFDREGNTLVLRPDMTPSIARCMAKYYRDETMPVRFCYAGSTFINNSSYQGKLKEATQLGAELINDASVEADAEMLALTVECLLDAGLTKFQVEVGHADFFRGLMEEAGFNAVEEEELRVLIENKNMFGVEELISGKKLPEALKDVVLKLPELFGTLDGLLGVRDKIQNPKALAALERLEQLYSLMMDYGLEKYITFDLGMLSKYNYYTGIIFRAYTLGTGDAVVTGGRYDSLVGQFGKDAPAIGMAVLVDQLMSALSRQKLLPEPEAENTLIVYQKELRAMAISLAKQFRGQGKKVELYLSEGQEKAEYIAYAERKKLGGVLYLQEAGVIEQMNAADGSWQSVSMEQLLG
ncbi:MAG: ATP phosphoribosyltransferase regulatory subunit [Lachnospiraceae bacterium]|nr:ATP phosphoribosyltransferase regulatory subunit [Lachnospiraceae bacterium]